MTKFLITCIHRTGHKYILATAGERDICLSDACRWATFHFGLLPDPTAFCVEFEESL
ncbi:hypothetical protein QJV46_gp40 [Serratia phage vB_SmaS_Opt-155]|uniref:Uncharacterized protein n=1 Tax=Serratia phage vB_SmaS_Opt-155 TaxID=2902690 RepID=A0AC61TQ01_9CAUD|nr:hypothetical protein QJV46_gp40 [Serratia phage vB_SmaS_Opt-155]UGO52744.1 hypothetical protein OPT155_40 [Serratia phage vB_SmaS_Opt-155]